MLADELREELEELSESNGLDIDFDYDYPVVIRLTKSMQVRILEALPEQAYFEIKFIVDDVKLEFKGNFNIDEKLLSKFVSKIKKFHYVYLQEQYEQKPNRFKNCIRPIFDTIKGDYVAIVKRHYEG